MSVTVDELLRRYATCATYRDEGTSFWRISDASSGIESRARFSTAFVRAPFRFRFFLEETASSLLIHATEDDVRVVSSNQPLQRHRTLRDAIKPTFGCAHGILMATVPLLLAWPDSVLVNAKELSFTRDAKDFEVALDARGAISSISESWSGHSVVGGPTGIEQRTSFVAELDVPIGDDELRFEATARTRRVLN